MQNELITVSCKEHSATREQVQNIKQRLNNNYGAVHKDERFCRDMSMLQFLRYDENNELLSTLTERSAACSRLAGAKNHYAHRE